MRFTLVLLVVSLCAGDATASSTESDWLAGLTDRVVGDLAAGRPLVTQVHVPLCDSSIIACGNAKLGDGENPETNLYWATTPGFGRWFSRSGSGWKRVVAQRADATGDADVRALHVYRRTVTTPASWRKRGVARTFSLILVIHAWRGTAIDRALGEYAADVSGERVRTIKLPDGTTVAAGGAAQLVAWVGHNRLMDLERYEWPEATTKPKGAIAIACHTAAYMEDSVAGAARVPLLMTRDLLFANAAPLEATILAFATGGDYRRIRSDATAAYAKVRDREVKRVAGAFTNPADARWKKRP